MTETGTNEGSIGLAKRWMMSLKIILFYSCFLYLKKMGDKSGLKRHLWKLRKCHLSNKNLQHVKIAVLHTDKDCLWAKVQWLWRGVIENKISRNVRKDWSLLISLATFSSHVSRWSNKNVNNYNPLFLDIKGHYIELDKITANWVHTKPMNFGSYYTWKHLYYPEEPNKVFISQKGC